MIPICKFWPANISLSNGNGENIIGRNDILFYIVTLSVFIPGVPARASPDINCDEVT